MRHALDGRMDKILGVGGPVKGLDALKTQKKYCIYISVYIVVVFSGKRVGEREGWP